VADGETFTVEEQESRGIDVARTVMITVAGDEGEVRIRERARLAAALLRDIASGTSSLDDEFLKILDDRHTDPLLRLLAAVVVVLRLEAGLVPLAGGRRAGRRRPPPEAQREWAERARRWLSIDKGLIIAPDETILKWRLAKLLGSAGRVRTKSSIAHPPMLAASWRWALDHSAHEPAALPPTTPNVAAARSGVLRDPWLCWKESASKAAPAIVQEGRTVVELAASIAARAKELIETSTSEGKFDTLFEELTPTASKIAHQAMRSAPDKLDSPNLAVALGLPGGALPSMLTMTEREIIKALEQLANAGPAPASPSGRPEIAPPTTRKILDPDDPQKGRFGGAAKREGFTLSATFSPTKSRNWVRIELRVEGPASEGEELEFHLHDSFRPAMQKCAFNRGCAKLAITAWGGFTVGVWILSRGVELELDLAKIRKAPHIIKTR